MKRDESTYGRIRSKYEEWEEIQAAQPARPRVQPPQRPYTPEPETDSDMGKTIFTAIGVGIGLALLALAALAFTTAASWGEYGRSGAYVGYNLVGFFLLLGGFGGILATWNHNFRLIPKAHQRSRKSH